ncbi:MAG: queuosine precursor transporter [Candidatus Cloacimonetes bacterium]|nr:queuosine precursor transporter [Candidatus Cloacimonadota bacterium]
MKFTIHEKSYFFLSSIFLTSLVVGNMIGTTKFVSLFSGTFIIPVGLLAYPITFLATDLICEVHGKKRAEFIVWVGFFINCYMLILMWLGHNLMDAAGVSSNTSTFEGVYKLFVANVAASMIAYLGAQSIDVKLFHFWKKLTKGKHLWLRNCGSTLISQIVDTVVILSILYYLQELGPNVNSLATLWPLILSSYSFKVVFAVLDTPLFYLGTYLLNRAIEGEAKLSS